MSGLEQGLLMSVVLLGLMALRMPIGLAMLCAGALGYGWLAGVEPLLHSLKHLAYARYSNYELSVIPLFILMGQFATRGGLSHALFDMAYRFIGHWRGGMAMAGIGACAGFGAICGSSLATAATMGQVVLPALRQQGYAAPFASASLAAGGTLGILIPPSVPLVLYAILTEQNIGKLFAAALIPGLLAVFGYMLVIAFWARVCEQDAPAVLRVPMRQRWQALWQTGPVLFIFGGVIGGIYGGWFTPTEAAAVGAIATGAIAWRAKNFGWQGIADCIYGTASACGMIFLIILGADVFNIFLALTQFPSELAQWVIALHWSPIAVLCLIVLIYVLLGCVMDSLSMLLLTVPIFFPIIMGLDFYGLAPDLKAIWFGIIVLTVVEIGLITPPVGLNVYVISAMAKDVSMAAIFRSVVPFLMSDLIRVGLLISFPALALWLLS